MGDETPPLGWMARLARHRVELRLSLRIVAAGLLTYAVAEAFGLAQGYWAVLTAVIVMQASLGGSLKAMLDRLVGTVAGAGCAIAVAVAMPRTGPVTTALALLLALLPVSLLTAFRPAYRMAPVTAVIVLLAPSGPMSAPQAGLARTLEIGFGTLVAFLVALLVLPSRAHQLLRQAAGDALAPIAEAVALLLDDLSQRPDAARMLALHDRVRAGVERADDIAREAADERSSRVSDTPDPDPLVRALRRVAHDLVMLGRLRARALPDPASACLTAPAAAVAAAAAGCIAAIGAVLAGRADRAPATAVADAVAAYRAATTALGEAGLPGDAEQIFGLAFALEQLARNLDELSSRAAEFAQLR